MKLWNYFKETSKEFYLEECGIDDYSNFPFYDYTVFQDFVIHWICEGKGYLEVAGQTYSLEKNDGFILKKGQKVRYWANQEDPWTTNWLGFSGEKLTEYLHNTQVFSEPVCHFCSHFQSRKIIEDICHKTAENRQKESWYRMQVFTFLYYLQEEFPAEMPLSTIQLPVEKAVQILLQQYAQDISIQELASQVGLSRSTLFRQFKKHYHKSPQQFLLETRLLKARTLLTDTDLSIKEITMEVGYQDQLVFSKAFKNYFSISPKFSRQGWENPPTD